MAWEMAIRVIFIISVIAAGYHLRPFHWSSLVSSLVGAVLAFAFVFIEMRLRQASLKRLIGAAVGGTLGVVGALIISHLLNLTSLERMSISYVQIILLLLLGYVGIVVGASKGDLLNLAAMGGIFAAERQGRKSSKILDTSVIIDGRIADICETGFIEGPLILPQFVLRELQLVADSTDPMKRNRGRRGLDVMHRIQKIATVQVQIVEEDFPHIREVDLKLIELAKKLEGKILTNDFNLNKVAQLQRVPVLNINELANALKPVVLPGEIMRVFILKEGKEFNQGVAYLDDGTMVVVDNAKKMISKTIDISVTSVLQTTAGKMIFGKYENSKQRAEVVQPQGSAGS
ncbi:MAG TPA: PIN domain-containing protein [Terriglobia bacterium]|nr:PIN domain-containing protein [Terriglobia bacterium]